MNKTQKMALFEQLFAILEKIKKLEPKLIGDDTAIVTPLQLSALGYLAKHPDASPGQLGAHLGLSPSAITQLTDRLVEMGFVERANSPIDRRMTTAWSRRSRACASFCAMVCRASRLCPCNWITS